MNKWLILYYLGGLYLKPIRSRKHLDNVMCRRLRRFENFLLRESPFYSALLQKFHHVLSLPVINKADYLANFNTINTVGVNYDIAMQVALRAEVSRDFTPMLGDISVGLSSGTSGNRGLFLTSSKERARWVAAIIHRVIGWSWRPRKVAFFLRANNNLYESARSRLLDFNFFDLSQAFEKLMTALNTLNPDILIGQPSVLLEIAKRQKSGDVSISPTKVISVAEVLEEDTKKELQSVFNQKIHQVYQCTEGFLAYTCREGNLHLNEDFIYVEPQFLEDDKIRFFPVITDMLRRTQPIVRYALNDILTLDALPCGCGSPFRVISSIEGREDDTLVFTKRGGESVLVFGDFIRKIFLLADSANQLINYQVIQNQVDKISIIFDHQPNVNIIQLQEQIYDGWTKFAVNHQLILPEIEFKTDIQFDPMIKFRRIIRNPFTLPIKTKYL